MSKQNQWLFEVPFSYKTDFYVNPYAAPKYDKYFEQEAPPAAEPPPYTPSTTRRNFERSVVINAWQDVFLNLNGLKMFEMLRALDEISPDRRCLLSCNRQPFVGLVNMPRIDYALSVVQNGALPAIAPGDLQTTGQVQTAQEFLIERDLRQTTVNVAVLERNRWKNGGITEKDQAIGAVLREYWRFGVGSNFSEKQLGIKAFQDKNPWSAAFISWVMRKSGAETRFRYSPAHAGYITWAKQNRLADNREFYKAYRVNEVQPRLGDLVCFSRGKVRATYDNIRQGMETHCDLVVTKSPQVQRIGGNVENSVCERSVTLNDQGFINMPECFAIIRLSAPWS